MRSVGTIPGSLAVLSLAVLSLGPSGCQSHVRYFKVTSYPEGATVYVDGEARGQTTFSRLEIDFGSEEKLVTMRVEKAGYQPTGAVLSSGSPGELAFFLEEAPQNREILEVLRSILKVLDRLSIDLDSRSTEEEP